MQASFPKRNWKRPKDIAPIPNVCHTFQTKDKWGKTQEIQIQDITPDQHKEAWDMFKDHFYPDEEFFRQVGFSQDPESMASAKLSFDYIVDQNLSVVAVLDDQEDKVPHIVGCLLLVVVNKQDSPPPELPGLARKKLKTALDLLRDDIDVFEELNSNYLLREHDLVVKREYRRMNIGVELFKTMERMAKIFHIPAAVTTTLNLASQSLSAKLGFIMLKKLKLGDYKDEKGQIIFPDLKAVDIQYG